MPSSPPSGRGHSIRAGPKPPPRRCARAGAGSGEPRGDQSHGPRSLRARRVRGGARLLRPRAQAPPSSPDALANRGNVLKELKRFSRRRPRVSSGRWPSRRTTPAALGGLADCALRTCDWARTGAIARQLVPILPSGDRSSSRSRCSPIRMILPCCWHARETTSVASSRPCRSRSWTRGRPASPPRSASLICRPTFTGIRWRI